MVIKDYDVHSRATSYQKTGWRTILTMLSVKGREERDTTTHLIKIKIKILTHASHVTKFSCMNVVRTDTDVAVRDSRASGTFRSFCWHAVVLQSHLNFQLK